MDRTMLAARPLPSPALETAVGLTCEPVVVRDIDDIVLAIEEFERSREAILSYEAYDGDFRRFASDALADAHDGMEE